MRIKECLTNNVGLKIIAVFIAAVVWLAVVNISDPEKTIIIYNVPITITNEEAITDMGMVYDLESADYVNITISGKRSIVSNLSADDFKATASLEELSKVNAVPVEVSARQSSISRKITIVKQSMQTITLNVEKIEKQEYPIEIELAGKTAGGYIVGSSTISKKTVTITAPTSVIDSVDKVVAVCNLDGSNSDIEQECTLELRDKHGDTVKRKHTKLSFKKATVYVDILKEKEVPISVVSIGKPQKGFQVTNVILSQENVKLYGPEDKLKDIGQLEITDEISIADNVSDVTVDIDLSKYLPEGVKIDGETMMQLTVKIEKLKTKSYSIKTSEISVKNLKDEATLTFTDKEIEIVLQGENAVIDAIKSEDLKAEINLKDYEKGTAKVPVTVDIPEGAQLAKDVYVKIKIKE